MRLVEFLILMLQAHAQTLKRLAALFGEDRLLGILEEAGDREEQREEFDLKASWFEKPRPGDPRSPYSELESAVRDSGLPEILEFHLWAYPHYRHYIESAIDLNTRIPGPEGDIGQVLINEAVAQAERWVRALGLPPAIAPQAERAAHLPWLQFRATSLKRIGKRPVMSV